MVKSPLPGIFVASVIIATLAAVFAMSATEHAFAQGAPSNAITGDDIVNALASEVIALLIGILGLGISALIAWLRKRGIPVTTEQETMIRP